MLSLSLLLLEQSCLELSLLGHGNRYYYSRNRILSVLKAAYEKLASNLSERPLALKELETAHECVLLEVTKTIRASDMPKSTRGYLIHIGRTIPYLGLQAVLQQTIDRLKREIIAEETFQ